MISGLPRDRFAPLYALDDAAETWNGEGVAPGDDLEAALDRQRADPVATCLHAHNAAHGGYVAGIARI